METSSPDFPYLAPSEFRIFSLLSKRGPLTIRDIGTQLARLDPEFRQGASSIGTLLQRLIQKGYVEQRGEEATARRFGAIYPYDQALRRHIERFFHDLMLDGPDDLRTLIEMALERLAPSSKL